MKQNRLIYIGYDPKEHDAYRVAVASIKKHLTTPISIHALVLPLLRNSGLYYRPTEKRVNESTGRQQLWDTISDAPMATEFAISRFLVPRLAGSGLALFLDSDILVRCDLTEVFNRVDPSKAVSCVQHSYTPSSAIKMDGQLQSFYARKNWSSVMVFNCDHQANKALTVSAVNLWPGRELHAFRWLKDWQIGALPATYNHLVGDHPHDPSAKIVHFTNGIPTIPHYADCPFSDEWWETLAVISGPKLKEKAVAV